MISRLLLAATVCVMATGCGSPSPPAPIRSSVPVPDDRVLGSFAVSPDGGRIAYSAESTADGRRRLYIRVIAGVITDRELIGTVGATLPFFSPDGLSVGYFARGAIWRVAVSGSVPARVVDAPVDSAGAAWLHDGRIVFAPLDTGLMSVSGAGGVPANLTTVAADDGELQHGWPHALPDGSIVFTVSQRGRDPHLEVLSAEGERTRLRVPIHGHAQFVDTGHVVYSFLGNLMAVKFDLDEREINGVPMVIAKGMQTAGGFGALGRSDFAVSQTGTLVWLRISANTGKSRLVRVDRSGRSAPLAAEPDVLQTPRLSPDGRRLAVVVRSGVLTREIRVLDAAQAERIMISIQGGDNQSPAWMDNRRLTFGSNRDGVQKIYVTSVDQKRPASPLFTANATVARHPASWARRLLALYEIEPARGRNVLVYRMGESISPVAATEANERSPAVSRDGKWIAYVSDASGRDEVYAARLDSAGESLRLTTSGATEPVWGREGLFYREGESLVLRAFDRGTLAPPTIIFEGHFERDPGSNLASYDIDPQGASFIMLKTAVKPSELRVVKNWGSELVGRLQ